MTTRDICFTPAVELAAMIRDGEVSSLEVVRAVLDRIERLNPLINAYCTVVADRALDEARAADATIAEGAQTGPLHGVPVSIKDLVATKGIRTTSGSPLFENWVPDYDAPLVERLRAAGAVILGKTNTPEFGHLAVTRNSIFGATANPWNLERTPGGSSGGAVAAVASGLGPLAEGSDGGGSIRIPASFTGVYGLKPSLGRVSLYPMNQGMEMLSVSGPITRTVADAALMLDVMAGPDDRDINSLPAPPGPFLEAASAEGVEKLRIAYSPALGHAEVEPEIAAIVERATRVFADLGCVVEETDFAIDSPADDYLLLSSAVYAAIRQDDLEEVRDRIDPGYIDLVDEVRDATAADYVRASMLRRDLCRRFGELMQRYDLLLTPTMPVPARPIDEPGLRSQNLGWNPFCPAFNMTGQPAASVPCGFTADGLPVGLQIVGRRFDEYTVLRGSAAFEAAAPWAGTRPPGPLGA